MGIEAFIWRYDRGENATMPLDDVLSIFAPFTDQFDAENGVLSVRFGDASNTCDIYLGEQSATTRLTNGLMISRPVRATQLWDCVLAVMRTGNIILFFSDDTTPLYATPGAPQHFPADLLDSIGPPKLVSSPDEILKSHEG